MNHKLLMLCAWVLISLLGAELSAQEKSALFLAGGAEGWTSAKAGGHGYLLAQYERDVLGGRLVAMYNTDTLMLSLSGYKISETASLGGYIKGQGGFAGLLPDYYQRAELLPGRGFMASYVQTMWVLSQDIAPHFLQLELGGRRWDFRRLDGTDEALKLPANLWELEPRVRYTYWDLAYDPATQQAHRHYLRVEGLAFGVELGANLRDRRQAFGALDAQRFDPVDLRNDGKRALFIARAWARAGHKLGQRLRLQGMLYGATGVAQDDLVRVRAGGTNPYVVPISGLPWASHLPDDLLASELSLHLKVLKDSEVGVMAQGALMGQDDLARVEGQDGWGGLVGVGLFGDWRLGDWQVDTRVGFAPDSTWLVDGPHLTAWLSVGKQIF